MPKKNIVVDTTVETKEKNNKIPGRPDDFSSKKAEMLSGDNSGKDWLEDEDYSGQLAIDVYQTKEDIVVKSTIAGVKPEGIDISINNDMITIRGKRGIEEEVVDEDYFYRECYWGGFSRSVILPCDVQVDKVKASMKNGILTVILPKASKMSKVTVVKVKEEE